jgi:outer membrane immunogenic protein
MRKVLLSTVALAALTGSALAADLPSRKMAPAYIAPVPAFSWTGFYVGIEGGADFLTSNVSVLGFGLNNTTTAGLIGGVVGYNYEFPNRFVLGLEGDVGGVLGARRNNLLGGFYTDNSYFADIRGRLGYAFADRALLYVAGGVAFGDVKTGVLGAVPALAVTSQRVGWTIGAGVDYAFTPNWIGRLEYRYVDLGTGGNYNYNNFYVNDGIKVTSNQIMAALLYKFGSPVAEAVVAKY